jgi:hypothetical protein
MTLNRLFLLISVKYFLYRKISSSFFEHVENRVCYEIYYTSRYFESIFRMSTLLYVYIMMLKTDNIKIIIKNQRITR